MDTSWFPDDSKLTFPQWAKYHRIPEPCKNLKILLLYPQLMEIEEHSLCHKMIVRVLVSDEIRKPNGGDIHAVSRFWDIQGKVIPFMSRIDMAGRSLVCLERKSSYLKNTKGSFSSFM